MFVLECKTYIFRWYATNTVRDVYTTCLRGTHVFSKRNTLMIVRCFWLMGPRDHEMSPKCLIFFTCMNRFKINSLPNGTVCHFGSSFYSPGRQPAYSICSMGAAKDVWQVITTYWSLLLGNALEWYEFCLFSFLEPYFQENFFQGSAVMTWMGFAITFVARPFGGIVLGLLGDIFGRKVSTFLSIFGMLCGTVLQGVLPTYKSHGQIAGTIGVFLLVFLRLVQGISAGGEIASVSTYITEIGHPCVLASTLVLIPVTSNLGYFCAQLMSFSFEEILGDDKMLAWGWRVPFLLALLPGSLAALGRRCIPESGQFLEAQACQAAQPATSTEKTSRSAGRKALTKMRDLLASYGPQVLVGLGSVASVSVLLYGGMTWGLVSLKKKGLASSFRILAGCGANSLVVFLAPVVGCVTDCCGAAWIQLYTSLVMFVMGMPLMMVIEWLVIVESPWSAVVLYSLGYGILGAFLMMHFLQVVELFPVEVRNAGVGLSYNVGVCLFGGFAPVLFEAVSFTSWLPGLLLALGGLVTVITTLISLQLQSLGKLQLTHLRHEPYFRCCGRERFAWPQEPSKTKGNPWREGEEDAVPEKQDGIDSVVQIWGCNYDGCMPPFNPYEEEKNNSIQCGSCLRHSLKRYSK